MSAAKRLACAIESADPTWFAAPSASASPSVSALADTVDSHSVAVEGLSPTGAALGAGRRGPRPLFPGRDVGPYVLIEPLGAGGQAEVWRAGTVRGPAREVALKLVRLNGPHRERKIARLRREGERGARLKHPALPLTLGFGTVGGWAYLAMSLVEGESLDRIIAARRARAAATGSCRGHWLANRPTPEYRAAVVAGFAQVARALFVAHREGVAHRDIKPANILFGGDPARRRAYLVDFGMGRDLGAATRDQLRGWSGSPVYMAPEKLRGQQEDEQLCDIYSLGAALFEALTLRRPREVPEGLSLPALWAYLSHRAPGYGFPPVSRYGIAPEIGAVVRKAMAPDPQQRFPSARLFAVALETLSEATAEA